MAHLNRKIGIPSFDMTGKTAIITGGTQGLGFGMRSGCLRRQRCHHCPHCPQG